MLLISASVGTEELAHMEIVSAILYQLTRNLKSEDQIELGNSIKQETEELIQNVPLPAFEFPIYHTKESVLMFLHEDMIAEQKAKALYDDILSQVSNPQVCDPIRFLRTREIVHYQRLGEAIQIVQEKMESDE